MGSGEGAGSPGRAEPQLTWIGLVLAGPVLLGEAVHGVWSISARGFRVLGEWRIGIGSSEVRGGAVEEDALLPPRLAYFSTGSLSTGSVRRLASVLSSGPANANTVVDAPDRFDAFLSAAELLCLAPSLALAVCGTVGIVFPRALPKLFRLNSGNALLAGQLVLLACAVLVGSVIRQRQRRGVSVDIGESECDLMQRIEKVEVDLRGSTTVIRVLSRQLEKLGNRFRVTRRTLKDPISETAALAQKNSEATRALALQADILEKELKEIQMVLLAMQEQQQKQLDLILTVGKAAKLFESKRTAPPPPVHDAAAKINSIRRKNELQPIDAQIRNNEDF